MALRTSVSAGMVFYRRLKEVPKLQPKGAASGKQFPENHSEDQEAVTSPCMLG